VFLRLNLINLKVYASIIIQHKNKLMSFYFVFRAFWLVVVFAFCFFGFSCFLTSFLVVC
jgi:hypothetical protein